MPTPAAAPSASSPFKRLALAAALQATAARADGGILLDDRYGRDSLDQATGRGLWIGRPIEVPGSRRLRFLDGPDLGSTLREWPVTHCVKCLILYHPDDPENLRMAQERQVRLLRRVPAYRPRAAAGSDPWQIGLPVDERLVWAWTGFTGSASIPDWWKLPDPGSDGAWEAIAEVIGRHDPHCRGVLLLGLDAPGPSSRRAIGPAPRVSRSARVSRSGARSSGRPRRRGWAIESAIWKPSR